MLQDALNLLKEQKEAIDQLWGSYIENTIWLAHKFGQSEVSLPVWAATEMINNLKRKATKVLTPEEVSKVPQGGVVWCEWRVSKSCEPLIRRGNDFKNDKRFLLLDEVTDCDDYLKDYRCWNYCPTEEQRWR